MTFNVLHILSRNGWKWEFEKSRDENYEIYSNTFLGDYEVKVYAIVSAHSEHQDLNGHLGVLWLECEYEYPHPHSYDDLEDMKYGMDLAEHHLLLIGMPFTPDYKFHGKNVANDKRRNEKLRKLYDLDNLEKNGKI